MAGQEDQQGAVGGGAVGPLDTALQDDQLVAPQGVLSNEGRFAASKVRADGPNQRCGGRLGHSAREAVGVPCERTYCGSQAMATRGEHGNVLRVVLYRRRRRGGAVLPVYPGGTTPLIRIRFSAITVELVSAARPQ